MAYRPPCERFPLGCKTSVVHPCLQLKCEPLYRAKGSGFEMGGQVLGFSIGRVVPTHRGQGQEAGTNGLVRLERLCAGGI